jgi:SPP1 gp7 family putative phage head morphogenesis protein
VATKRRDPRAIGAAKALQVQIRPVELRFVSDLRRIMGGFHRAFVDYLEPAIPHAVGGHGVIGRVDAGAMPGASGNASRDIDILVEHLVPQLASKVGKAHDVMSAGVSKVQKKTIGRVFPIDFMKQPASVQYAARKARDASIGLVEDAARVYATQVRALFNSPETTIGRRVEDLRDDLIGRGNVSESRAALIARDQTLKLNSFLNQAHQNENGVTRYTWSTSGDERVRDTHAELDGDDFEWGSPPMIDRGDGTSEALNPGEDYQCRCVAIPIIGGLEGI